MEIARGSRKDNYKYCSESDRDLNISINDSKNNPTKKEKASTDEMVGMMVKEGIKSVVATFGVDYFIEKARMNRAAQAAEAYETMVQAEQEFKEATLREWQRVIL